MLNLNPVPQVEALGQLNRPFSQEAWGCVLFCCPCSALGFWLAKYYLYDYYSPMELRHTSCLGHQGQERKGCPLCGLCVFAGFSWAVGEGRVCNTLDLFEKAGRKRTMLTRPGRQCSGESALSVQVPTGFRLEVGEGQDHLLSPGLDWEWGSVVPLCSPASAGVGTAWPSLLQQGSRKCI